jgi:signal peptidase I
MKVLRLTLKKQWFDMIASGEKKEEYRLPSNWIESRLVGKAYDVVEFKNGYGVSVPTMIVKYRGFYGGHGKPEWGADPDQPYFVICLGEVLETRNLRHEKTAR